MSDGRDTLILPCRHLCCCSQCADSLRFQVNNCPICRAPFRALLQIRAVRKSNNTLSQVSQNAENQREPSQDIPPGYEAVSLIEALNGPMQQLPPLVPSFVPQIPPFSNSPDIRQKLHLERHHSSTASLRHVENPNAQKDDPSSNKSQGDLEEMTVPEVVVASMLSSDKEKDAELAETKSLLESNIAVEEMTATVSSPKTSRPCSRNSPISLSTPHSLHLCEKSSKDTSPGGDDSDYYTPEDPSTTILVDQGTDTSLDTPQNTETNESSSKTRNEYPSVGKHKVNRERHSVIEETVSPDGDVSIHDRSKKNTEPLKKPETNSTNVKSPNCHPLVNLENLNSLPGTPASNASNHSSGDSFSSTSSTRLLLRPQSYDTLPE